MYIHQLTNPQLTKLSSVVKKNWLFILQKKIDQYMNMYTCK